MIEVIIKQIHAKVNLAYLLLRYGERAEATMKIYAFEGKYNVSGANIRRIRERLCLSQDQLAARMQVEGVQINQKAISRIELGSRVVTDYELMVLARVLNVPLQTLVEEAKAE